MTLPSRFSVCPHDTAKGVDRWALFHTLVNKQLRLGTRFLPHFDFKEFETDLQQPGCLWAYLNPAHFLKARALHGCEALVRPKGRPDKAYLVGLSSEESSDSISVEGQSVAAVDGYLLKLFAQNYSGFDRKAAKSYGDVLTQIDRKEVRFGVTYNEHFDNLSQLIRDKYRVLAVVDIGLSHVIAVSSEMPEEAKEGLRQLLLSADKSPDGQKVLETFGTTGFEAVPMAPYELLAAALGQ